MAWKKEGLVKRIVDTVDGEDNDVVMLTEEGKRMFSEQEEALEKRAEELFGDLTEGEKMQLMCCCARSRELQHMNRNLLPMCANEQELHKCQSKAATLLL